MSSPLSMASVKRKDGLTKALAILCFWLRWAQSTRTQLMGTTCQLCPASVATTVAGKLDKTETSNAINTVVRHPARPACLTCMCPQHGPWGPERLSCRPWPGQRLTWLLPHQPLPEISPSSGVKGHSIMVEDPPFHRKMHQSRIRSTAPTFRRLDAGWIGSAISCYGEPEHQLLRGPCRATDTDRLDPPG